MDSIEKSCNYVKTVNGFYLGDTLNSSGGCEAAVTVRAKIGWAKITESGELLLLKIGFL